MEKAKISMALVITVVQNSSSTKFRNSHGNSSHTHYFTLKSPQVLQTQADAGNHDGLTPLQATHEAAQCPDQVRMGGFGVYRV